MSKKAKRNRKPKKPQGPVKKTIKTVLSVLALGLMLGTVYKINTPAVSGYLKMGQLMLGGVKQSFDNSKSPIKGKNASYNKSDFSSKSELTKAEKDTATQISGEGTVLLKNDAGNMPFKQDQKFSFFSANSVPKKASGLAAMVGGSSLNIKQSFQQAGLQVNNKLWNFYAKGAGSKYGLAAGSISFGDAEDFSINEAPLSKLQKAKGVLDSVKGTVPVYVLKRVAGEGRDMPRSMANHAKSATDKKKSYLDPDTTELQILKYLNDHFTNTVVVVNSNAAIDLNWLKQFPNIKSVVFAPTIDASLGKIFTGKVNPSARTVDTFADNALNSPAAQNFGDYQYQTASGKMSKYNYVSYAEGIYTGYKYYETRYEDKVLNQGNAGDYNYQDEVVYPFGYGLSYTKFDWSHYQTSENKQQVKVSVDVTNSGKHQGKDVVEVYAQSPYTDYDQANKVEKPSVQLVGYAKTKSLEPGEKQTVHVTVNKSQLRAYDANKAKAYILDKGTYYFTAAKDAHAAINNILAEKGSKPSNGMTSAGDKSFVSTWLTGGNTPVTVFKTDSQTGAKVTNQFDDAKGDVTYLSRSNWTKTFPKHDGQPSDQKSTWGNEVNGTSANGAPASYTWSKKASAKLLQKLASFDSKAPKLDTKDVKLTYNADNGLSLIDLRGKAYNDPQWDKLLDELSAKDLATLVGKSGYGIDAIKKISKPFNIDADTASGLIYGGTGAMYANSMTLAQTWNAPLARKMGRMIGNDAIAGGATGWYAPSMNLHRTPFSGRNGEYYSEDAFLSGSTASNQVYGAASKGVYAYIKHFALNDQENHRGDRNGQFGVATWANEQSIREDYLLPFKMCVDLDKVPMKYYKKVNGKYELTTKMMPATSAVMTSFNRIGATWAGGDYNLLTNVLRKEWGFVGTVMTDNANTSKYMNVDQMIAAGGDAKLINAKDLTNFKFDKNNKTQYIYARQAAKNILYTTVNSKAMNGALPGAKLKYGIQSLHMVRYIIDVLFVGLSALLVWFTYRRFWGKRKQQ